MKTMSKESKKEKAREDLTTKEPFPQKERAPRRNQERSGKKKRGEGELGTQASTSTSLRAEAEAE